MSCFMCTFKVQMMPVIQCDRAMVTGSVCVYMRNVAAEFLLFMHGLGGHGPLHHPVPSAPAEPDLAGWTGPHL